LHDTIYPFLAVRIYSMTISVVTPVYNGANYIESCINNVIEQQCSRIEHIIIDGASDDGTTLVIKRFADQHPHIRWISEKDRAQSDAMNKGIFLAKGDIIGVLNVDDYYEPGVLQRVTELFKTLPEPSLLIGNCNMWGNDGDLLDVNRPSRLQLTDLLIGDEARYPFPVNPSAYFYHKSLHKKIGLYNVDEQYAMDIDFLLRAIPNSHVVYIDEVLGNYRLIRGTKTYEDMKTGRTEVRLQKLIHEHRSKLPPYQQYKVIFLGHLYKLWRTIQKKVRKG